MRCRDTNHAGLQSGAIGLMYLLLATRLLTFDLRRRRLPDSGLCKNDDFAGKINQLSWGQEKHTEREEGAVEEGAVEEGAVEAGSRAGAKQPRRTRETAGISSRQKSSAFEMLS